MNINDFKRIIFKFGTNVLRNDDKEISLSRIYSFIEDISKLHKAGKEIIIVTSGAVGLGAKKLNVDSSESLSIKQACAAVGQSQLMSIYEDGFNKYSINTAQVLLTEDDLSNRIKYLSLNNVLNALLGLNVIPIKRGCVKMKTPITMLCHSERSEESVCIKLMFTDPSQSSG
jgi:glutamate 5-kinase